MMTPASVVVAITRDSGFGNDLYVKYSSTEGLPGSKAETLQLTLTY